MKKIIAALLIMMNVSAMAQTAAYDVSKDAKNGEVVFNGPVTFDDLNKEPTFTWLKSGVGEYKPDEQTLNILKEQLKNYSIVVFLGTWCDDSHELIPKFLKVLQLTGYPVSAITMYGVDREKTTKGGENTKYNITLVPTIILFKDGKEVSRITETVQKSIEGDLEKLLLVRTNGERK